MNGSLLSLRTYPLMCLAVLLMGCAATPHRPYVRAITENLGGCKAHAIPAAAKADLTTPEISRAPPYTLHFLEFDDQGWPYKNTKTADSDALSSSEEQSDCAIADLANRLENGINVRLFVYVHGWNHSADNGDRDLKRFRELLAAQASNPGSERQVVGLYVGWNGKTSDIPVLSNATFWGRKNAAHHVSEGSVRDLFSRIKALRNHWNRPARSPDCGKPQTTSGGRGCPLRTVMIGHSFGAWVLYSATSPYILETLSGTSDLPKGTELPTTVRERGIADLVVLLNPAFEASRYEPVVRAARRYRIENYHSPLLVSITSTADLATKDAFPIARFFNSIFQYPATSDEQSIAMKHTHGHIDKYITHELTVDTARMSVDPNSEPTCVVDAQGHRSDMREMRERFFSAARDPSGNVKLDANWVRPMCGGLKLTHVGHMGVDPHSIVWNIRTFKDVIPDHNGITTLPLRDFVTQLYGDIGFTGGPGRSSEP